MSEGNYKQHFFSFKSKTSCEKSKYFVGGFFESEQALGVNVILLAIAFSCCIIVGRCEEKNLHVESEVGCCYASDQRERLMGFHTHPHLCGGSSGFLTASVTSCWNSLDMALSDT